MLLLFHVQLQQQNLLTFCCLQRLFVIRFSLMRTSFHIAREQQSTQVLISIRLLVNSLHHGYPWSQSCSSLWWCWASLLWYSILLHSWLKVCSHPISRSITSLVGNLGSLYSVHIWIIQTVWTIKLLLLRHYLNSQLFYIRHTGSEIL